MNRQEYKSATYYKAITGIEFVPLSYVDIQPEYRKGDLIRRLKIFGYVLSEKYAECDLYKMYDGLVDIKRYADYCNLRVDQNGNLYKPAKVVIGFPKTSNYQYFDSDEEAMAFVNDLRNKCNSCDNKLM
jgi:hypothetical protein